MSRLSWTPSARADLRAINDWLIRETSPSLALRIVVAIRARANDLENFPRIGRPYVGGLRILRVVRTPYLVRYRINDSDVEVIRVHHERENWRTET